MTLTASEYVALLCRDGQALADAAEGRLDAPVPSCPEWTMADLVWHTANVHRFWHGIASGALSDPEEFKDEDRPAGGGLVEAYRAGVDRVADCLETADPATAVWTWAPQKDIAFIQRRMAQETAVHRWDAEAASGGSPAPIDPALAVDGVDEFFEFMLPGWPAALAEGGESVHLHATDVDGEWTAVVANGRLTVDRAHGKGDAAVRASASDLLLLLWRRIGPEGLEVFGDEAALGRFLARPSLG